MVELADFPIILAAIPLGLAIGAVVGTVGGGGAILALPALVYLLDQGVGAATTASLVVVAVAASFGAGARERGEGVCRRTAVAFAVPAAAGAVLGTLAGDSVSPKAQILAFVPLMAIAAAATWIRGGEDGESAVSNECPPLRRGRAVIAGLAVGALTGFFGVGGGFLIVPALTIALGLPLRRAIATSLAIVAATGLVALGVHLAQGADPEWTLTIALSLSTAAGAVAGARYASSLDARTLARAFAALVAALAAFMLIDVLVLGGPPGA